MIQVLDPHEWIIQIKGVGYKSGKEVNICGNLGQIWKSEIAQMFLQQMKNLCIMQKKKFFI